MAKNITHMRNITDTLRIYYDIAIQEPERDITHFTLILPYYILYLFYFS